MPGRASDISADGSVRQPVAEYFHASPTLETWRDVVRSGITTAMLGRCSIMPLRLVVGYGFVAHGYAKIVNGPDHFAASLHALGVPASRLMAWLTIGCELLGGLAILVGAWIPLVSLPLSVIMLV